METTYVIFDAMLTPLAHQSNVRADVPDSEIIIAALVTAKYFAHNHNNIIWVNYPR